MALQNKKSEKIPHGRKRWKRCCHCTHEERSPPAAVEWEPVTTPVEAAVEEEEEEAVPQLVQPQVGHCSTSIILRQPWHRPSRPPPTARAAWPAPPLVTNRSLLSAGIRWCAQRPLQVMPIPPTDDDRFRSRQPFHYVVMDSLKIIDRLIIFCTCYKLLKPIIMPHELLNWMVVELRHVYI